MDRAYKVFVVKYFDDAVGHARDDGQVVADEQEADASLAGDLVEQV